MVDLVRKVPAITSFQYGEYGSMEHLLRLLLMYDGARASEQHLFVCFNKFGDIF